jgi:hypothetical protein
MKPSLDINRLEMVKQSQSRTSARCPACAAEGSDKSGTNLSIQSSSGAFTCAKYPGETGRDHRREIFRLVGIKQERTPAEESAWRREKAKGAAEIYRRKRVSDALSAKRQSIIAAHPWPFDEVRKSSPPHRNDPRSFIAGLFNPQDIVWTGSVRDSGRPKDAHHWKTASEWQTMDESTIGPMISPAVWKPGVISRAKENVLSSPFTVLDFDGLDGIKPGSPEELREHLDNSLAVVRWLRESLSWRLAALLFTGSKSIHAWFYSPPSAALKSLEHTANILGVDAGLIGHPEHPCRLPGWMHQKTGLPSEVLWMDS